MEIKSGGQLFTHYAHASTPQMSVRVGGVGWDRAFETITSHHIVILYCAVEDRHIALHCVQSSQSALPSLGTPVIGLKRATVPS